MSGIDASEVDEGVLGELPEAIQQQIRNQMRMAAAVRPAAAKRTVSRVVRSAAASADVPDMGKRNVMNLLLVGAIGLPATSLLGGYAYFFVPPR